MYPKITFLLLLFGLLGFSMFSSAEEHGGGPAEAKAEGGAGVEKRGPKSREQKNFDEWLEISQKLEKVLTKVKAKKQTIEDLIKDKDKEKDDAKKMAIIQEMNNHHHEYNKMIQDYEKLRTYVLYRFPERSNENKRSYIHVESQSIEEIEKGMGLEAKVKKIIHKMAIQYESKERKEPGAAIDKKEERSPSSLESGEKLKTGITETVILKK